MGDLLSGEAVELWTELVVASSPFTHRLDESQPDSLAGFGGT